MEAALQPAYVLVPTLASAGGGLLGARIHVYGHAL